MPHPETLPDTPARLVRLPVILSRISDEELGVDTGEGVVTGSLDLAAVVLVIPETDDDFGPLARRCEVTLSTGHTLCVAADADEVTGYWVRYRNHADKIGRLRN